MKIKLLIIVLYFIFMRIKCECLRIRRKPYFSILNKNDINANVAKNKFINNDTTNHKNIINQNNNKKESKFIHYENNKKISIDPLFDSVCKNVSVSEACLYNMQGFFNKIIFNNENNKLFCGILYGKYENDNSVKIENVFFSTNSSHHDYNVDYLLNSNDREKMDKLAKLLNLQVVGFFYAYPDIGVDLNEANQKKKNFIKLNKKIKTLNHDENEIFIPMGGKEVFLALKVMKQVLTELIRKNKHEKITNGEGKKNNEQYTHHDKNRDKNCDKNRDKNRDNDNDNLSHKDSKKGLEQVNIENKGKKKKKKYNENLKPFIILSVGMNKKSKGIIVEAYEMNNDLIKLINNDMIKDIEKQNSILQFEKKQNVKETKIKNFDSEIDLMNELYLKCKNNIFIKKIEIKKVDILFCVNNVPIFSHKSSYNYFFPYPNNSNYYNILQKFNNTIKSLKNKTDIVNLFKDLNFLFFLTNIFSIQDDLPYICKVINNANNSLSIPDQYIQILKNLSKNTNFII
ncbi:hypothetical protein YYC_03715 [Plasmodium yoelii 17X]|uniref:JAB1/MPN/MOV34 metalloenzyme domain-containing protein n=1 Tax=Plasmodium yoelii 17X TaxID=1323249 RepID=V7PIZ1_PLAYE|nr:hypothetical protein YYC_03715 [Plasmodium yoelii 17X]